MEHRIKILVVDDLPENLALVAGLLRERYEMLTAENGEQAVSLALEANPDLVLLDIDMPVMDGFEACKNLKRNPDTRDIPIIFLTAKDEPSDVIKGLKLGAADYVTKPFDIRVLKARVDNIIELDRRQKQTKSLLHEHTSELQLVEAAKTEAALKNHIHKLQLVFPSLVKFVTQIRNYLNGCYADACKSHGIDLLNLDLCLSEALANAIVHGNLGVDSSLKQQDWAKFDALLAEREADHNYAEKTVTVSYELGP